MSVYMRSILHSIDLQDSSVAHAKPSRWGVAAIPPDVLIDEEQTLRPDPVIEPPVPHPCDPAHTLVEGVKRPKPRREPISKASPLVFVAP